MLMNKKLKHWIKGLSSENGRSKCELCDIGHSSCMGAYDGQQRQVPRACHFSTINSALI